MQGTPPRITGHVLWDYINRRRLMVQSLTTNQCNYFPLRKTLEKHMSYMLTFVQVDVNSRPDKIEDLKDVDEKDDHPNGDLNAEDHVAQPGPPVQSLADAAELLTNVSPNITRVQESMRDETSVKQLGNYSSYTTRMDQLATGKESCTQSRRPTGIILCTRTTTQKICRERISRNSRSPPPPKRRRLLPKR